MADEEQTIRIRVVTEGVTESTAQLNKAGAAVQGLDEAGTKGSSALKGVGFAAKGLAHEVGISGGMARLFGHEVSDMAGQLGGAGLAFGIVGIAAIAAYKIYENFKNTTKEHREQLEKDTGQLYEHTRSLYANKLETVAVMKAKQEMAEAERAIYLSKSLDMLKEERDQLKGLQKDREEGMGIFKRWWIWWKSGFDPNKDAHKELQAAVAKYNAELDQSIAKLEKKINLDQKERESVLHGGTDPNGVDEGAFARLKEMKADEAVVRTAALASENTYMSQRTALYRAYGSTDQQIYQADMEAFDAATEAKKKNIFDINELKEWESQRSMQRTAKEAENQLKTDKMKMDSMQATAQNFSQAFQTMASMGGKHGRAYFTAYKTSATAEAIISTYQGASKALGQGGAYGYVLAAAVIAAGLANVAKIQSQTYDGGGGAGATPTYSANPATGLPPISGTGGGTIILNVNGQKVGEYKQLAGDVLQTIWENNGSVDGYSVMVERHA